MLLVPHSAMGKPQREMEEHPTGGIPELTPMGRVDRAGRARESRKVSLCRGRKPRCVPVPSAAPAGTQPGGDHGVT